MKKTGYTYRYEKKLNVGDPLNYAIVRSGVEERITLGQFFQNYRLIQKQMLEDSGKMKIAEAFIENIERNHPEVKKYTDEQLHVIATYKKAQDDLKLMKNNAKEYDIALKEYRRDFKDITTTLNLDVELPKD